MPNPNYCHTLTLFHKEVINKKDSWQRQIIDDCYYHQNQMASQSGTEQTKSSDYVVRISDVSVKVSPGDVIVYGSINDEITGEKGSTATELLRKYMPDAFRVVSVNDNSKSLYGKHIKVTG